MISRISTDKYPGSSHLFKRIIAVTLKKVAMISETE